MGSDHQYRFQDQHVQKLAQTGSTKQSCYRTTAVDAVWYCNAVCDDGKENACRDWPCDRRVPSFEYSLGRLYLVHFEKMVYSLGEVIGGLLALHKQQVLRGEEQYHMSVR